MSHLVANIAPLMNEYAAAVYKKEIQTPIYINPEMERLFTPIAADRYVAPAGSITDLFQACQCPPVAKGDTSFTAEEITTECGEIYYQISACDLEKHWKKWQYQWHQPNTKPDAWRFAEYVYTQLLVPKATDELDNIAYNGVKVAPTVGTAGTVLGTFTGLKKRLIDGRDRGTDPINKVDVGTLLTDGTDRYDKVNTFFDGMTSTFQSLPGTLYMSTDEMRKYMRAKRAEYPYEQLLNDPELGVAIDDFPGKRIKGLTRMNGSKLWFFVPDMYKSNLVMLHGLEKPIIPQGFWWVTDDLSLRFKAEYFRGYGFEYAKGLVVNDQTV